MALDEPKRTTLTSLRDTIMAIVPDAEQCISYGLPAFRLRGKTIAGFAAFKNHLNYLPHSGSVVPQLAKETAAYTSTRDHCTSLSTSLSWRHLCRSFWLCGWPKLSTRGSPGGRPPTYTYRPTGMLRHGSDNWR
jgi:hypothetical protein